MIFIHAKLPEISFRTYENKHINERKKKDFPTTFSLEAHIIGVSTRFGDQKLWSVFIFHIQHKNYTSNWRKTRGIWIIYQQRKLNLKEMNGPVVIMDQNILLKYIQLRIQAAVDHFPPISAWNHSKKVRKKNIKQSF